MRRSVLQRKTVPTGQHIKSATFATLINQIIPADNMQIIEEVKQIVPAVNTGTDCLIQLLFRWDAAILNVIKNLSVQHVFS